MPYEGVTTALQLHGDLFQQRCLQEVERAEWQVVDTELPVHIGDESSAVDVWAEFPAGDFSLQAIIECKRSHPDYRVWVFLNMPSSAGAEFPVVYQERGMTLSSAKKELSIFSDMRAPRLAIAEHYAQLGREVARAPALKQLTKEFEEVNRPRGRRPPGERIAHACYQVALGIRSVVRDEVLTVQDHSWRTTQGLSTPRFYLPLVVTTAELLYGSVAAGTVRLDDGTVSRGDVSYEAVEWLLYGYPLPEGLQLFPMDGLGNQYRPGRYQYTEWSTATARPERKLPHVSSVRGVTRYKRLPILIVRAGALKNCLESLVRRGWSGVV